MYLLLVNNQHEIIKDLTNDLESHEKIKQKNMPDQDQYLRRDFSLAQTDQTQ